MNRLDLVVVGLGYVGLPLAHAAVNAGLHVAGFDINSIVVDRLKAGTSHIDDIRDEDVHRMLSTGFEATTDSRILSRAKAICVCVPTPLSREGGPDLSAVRSASQAIAQHLSEGTLVAYESTTYPGSTEKDAKPILESGGLRAGQDFSLAFSPERVDPGNSHYGVQNTPKVVGGYTPQCLERAVQHYSRFIERVVPANGLREAEMSKLLENTYRHVNIALVNEMAKFSHSMGIDIWDVIRCASTKPFGFQPFYPGPGVGGHCIPIDPNYLAHTVQSELGYRFRFVELAQEINHGMPAYVVERSAELLNMERKPINGSRILLLGVAYKSDIADVRETPAEPIVQEFMRRGAELSFHDPRIPEWSVDNQPVQRVSDPYEAARSADLTVLLQAHAHYAEHGLADARLLFDTRGTSVPHRGARL